MTELILEKSETNGRLFPLNPAEYQLLNGLPQNIAAIPVDEFEYETSTLFGKQNRNVYLMCLCPDTYDGQISADDIANCLHHRKVRKYIDQNDRCYGIAYSNFDLEHVRLRGFVWTGDVLQVTEFFALNLPKAINVKAAKGNCRIQVYGSAGFDTVNVFRNFAEDNFMRILTLGSIVQTSQIRNCDISFACFLYGC